MFFENLKKAKSAVKKDRLGAFIVTDHTNIFYTTGFRGISPTEREAILILSNKPKLITARLYQREAQKLKSKDLAVFIAQERKQISEAIKTQLSASGKIGFESQNLTFDEFKRFSKLAHKKLHPKKDLIEKVRLIKNGEEIRKIKKAQIISQKSFEDLLPTLKAGQNESEIRDTLVKILKNNGSHGLAFEPIIASGPNSGLPHYLTGQDILKRNDILLLDFGAKYQGYCADLTRTIFIGKPSDEARNIYSLVYKAQSLGIKAVKNNEKAHTVHMSAEKLFKKYKTNEHFIHSLGHGIGLDIHEKPTVSKKSNDILKNGMVFSVEPGLYFDWGGIRIEDLVALQNNKATVLGRRSPFIILD